MADRPEESDGATRSGATAGDRIQTLLDSCAAGGAAARERAEQLVREVVELYGAGLERIIAARPATRAMTGAAGHRRLGGQPAAGPRPAPARRASAGLRRAGPGAAVPGLARRRCAPARVIETMRRHRAAAVRRQLQELPVVGGDAGAGRRGRDSGCRAGGFVDRGGGRRTRDQPAMIPGRIAAGAGPFRMQPTAAAWHPVPELADLAPGEVGGFPVAGATVLVCRVGDQSYAYRDHCPACDGSRPARRCTSCSGDACCDCPRCARAFRRRARRRRPRRRRRHLDPLPLLLRDGVLSVALPRTDGGGRMTSPYDVLARIRSTACSRAGRRAVRDVLRVHRR